MALKCQWRTQDLLRVGGQAKSIPRFCYGYVGILGGTSLFGVRFPIWGSLLICLTKYFLCFNTFFRNSSKLCVLKLWPNIYVTKHAVIVWRSTTRVWNCLFFMVFKQQQQFTVALILEAPACNVRQFERTFQTQESTSHHKYSLC